MAARRPSLIQRHTLSTFTLYRSATSWAVSIFSMAGSLFFDLATVYFTCVLLATVVIRARKIKPLSRNRLKTVDVNNLQHVSTHVNSFYFWRFYVGLP
jgi:hypothetical protein